MDDNRSLPILCYQLFKRFVAGLHMVQLMIRVGFKLGSDQPMDSWTLGV